MGVHLKYGTAGATGGGFSCQPGSLQPSFAEDRFDTRPDYCWQRRAARTWKDNYGWISLYPSMRFCGGADVGQGYTPLGMDLAGSGMYEPYSCDGEGTQSKNFFLGTCKDSGGNVVANAIVQAFRTSDDAFAGEVQGRLDGTYALGVDQLKSTPHYLVAYKAGSPDIAGTTVNTLLPTNVDGS